MKKEINNSCKVSRKGTPFCKPNIATEDIVCYKVIERRGNDAYALIDPNYKYEDVSEGSIVKGYGKYIKNSWFNRIFLRQPKEIFREEYIEWNEKEQWYDITYGFIHTLPYCPENMKEGYLPLECKRNSHFELWECIIPKGTRYYQVDRRGSHWESNNSYASKRIKFVKKLDECTYSGWFNE